MKYRKLLMIIFCMCLMIPSVYAGKKRIYTEKFENIEEGQIPKGWTVRQSASSDLAGVVSDFAYQGKKGLRVKDVSDGTSMWINSQDFKTYITGDYQLSFSFRIVGGYSGRASFVLLDENGDKAVGIICRLEDNWRYSFKNSLWYDLPNLPVPVSGEFYDVSVLVDSNNKRMNVIINKVESGWIDIWQGWSYISKISFAGNDNHPAEFWIDDLTLSEAQFKKPK